MVAFHMTRVLALASVRGCGHYRAGAKIERRQMRRAHLLESCEAGRESLLKCYKVGTENGSTPSSSTFLNLI